MQLDNNTKFDINIKWLIQIVCVATGAAWGYFNVTSELNQHKMDIMRMNEYVTMNSDFRVKWPLGQLGSLPDDAEQNLRLKYIEKDIEKLLALTEELKTKSIKQEVENQVKEKEN